ncbi:MAG: hypothetical protein GIKADHBN_01025 [Phycisphaerales bacterium]|nr:hypothetical protein [Phycisphaerales bacterium]
MPRRRVRVHPRQDGQRNAIFTLLGTSLRVQRQVVADVLVKSVVTHLRSPVSTPRYNGSVESTGGCLKARRSWGPPRSPGARDRPVRGGGVAGPATTSRPRGPLSVGPPMPSTGPCGGGASVDQPPTSGGTHARRSARNAGPSSWRPSIASARPSPARGSSVTTHATPGRCTPRNTSRRSSDRASIAPPSAPLSSSGANSPSGDPPIRPPIQLQKRAEISRAAQGHLEAASGMPWARLSALAIRSSALAMGAFTAFSPREA